MIYTALDTFYLADEQISNSPSRKDGVDEETETILRHYGCELIQEAGILLKLPQAVMATGQVLFHRFYCKKSFARFNVKRAAASCVWLAAKLEESQRKIAAVLNVFHRLDRRREGIPLDLLDPFSKKYEEMKTELITTERHLLKEMGFICHVEHPHKFIINYILQLNAAQLMQDAWSMANDSLRTTLCVRYKSEVVACGVVYAAARRHLVALPENPPWWEAFDAKKPDIDEVCRVLANLYQQPKARYIEVGRDVKPFALTSRAWDPPPDVRDSLLRTVGNGAGPSSSLLTSSSVERGLPSDAATAAAKGVADKNRISGIKEAGKTLDAAQLPSTNGDARDYASAAKSKHVNDREDTTIEKNRDKDSDRAVDRERERERDWDRGRGERERERIRERDREREREKERERIKERDYRNKERIRDSGHSDKSRHLSSSRDRDFQSSHSASRDKDRHRHRHHPYA